MKRLEQYAFRWNPLDAFFAPDPTTSGARSASRRARRALAALGLALLLGGCSLSSTIGEHGIAYNGTVEDATNAVLVLNVLRARDRAPLHFTTVGAIHGAFSLSAGLGYDLTAVNNGLQPALLAASSPSFDIGPLDRQEFARGLMRPMDPTLLRLLSDQGMPDRLLLHLLVARFDAGPGGAATPNDPAARRCDATTPACDPFGAAVEELVRHGRLHFNGYTRLVPLGPALTRMEAAKPELLAALREPGVTLRPDRGGWRMYRLVDQLVLCVPLAPDRAGQRAYLPFALDTAAPQVSPLLPVGDPCNADEVADTAAPAGRGAAAGAGWHLRSVHDLLAYLGTLQRLAEAGRPYRLDLGDGSRPVLFQLRRQRPERPRLQVSYGGQPWWVAADDGEADLTLRVLALTTQLLNLQKAAGEIPSTGTLRLVR